MLRGEQPSWAASGYGDGYGYGYGYGDGYGYGYGDGYGDGSGYGSGSGSGSGSGYGSGYGYGYGDGSGYGYGSASYWLASLQYFGKKWTDAQRERLEQLKALGAKICFWRSKTDGTAIHGKKCEPAKPGLVQEVKGPLAVCTERALHGTELPPKWPGDRLWVVALIGETQQQADKYGALKREIIGECL